MYISVIYYKSNSTLQVVSGISILYTMCIYIYIYFVKSKDSNRISSIGEEKGIISLKYKI